jgi:hypothetical protein
MVTKAIGEMVTERFGEEFWEDIKAEANLDIDVFVSNAGYPDEITYALVMSASSVLGLPVEDILRDFGRYWILETAQRGYAELINANGRTLWEFLINLPNFHTRVAMIFPNLDPPRFECTEVTEHSLVLHYHTHRSGLAPFVIGLLDGLSTMFDTPITVEQNLCKSEGATHDRFLIQWSPVAVE